MSKTDSRYLYSTTAWLTNYLVGPCARHGTLKMFVNSCRAIWLTLVVLWALSGCNGNYKFNDASYRPLGDSHAISRMK